LPARPVNWAWNQPEGNTVIYLRENPSALTLQLSNDTARGYTQGGAEPPRCEKHSFCHFWWFKSLSEFCITGGIIVFAMNNWKQFHDFVQPHSSSHQYAGHLIQAGVYKTGLTWRYLRHWNRIFNLEYELKKGKRCLFFFPSKGPWTIGFIDCSHARRKTRYSHCWLKES